MMFSVVVLPEPDGPRMATNSLSLKARLTWSRAIWVNDEVTYFLQMSLSSSIRGLSSWG